MLIVLNPMNADLITTRNRYYGQIAQTDSKTEKSQRSTKINSCSETEREELD